MSQNAIDSSAVLGFVRNQIYFYRQRNPVSLTVPTAVDTRRKPVRAVPRRTHHGSYHSQQRLSGATSADRLPPRDSQ
eukprot:4908496-Pleurochrysis_carterae.AAC.1